MAPQRVIASTQTVVSRKRLIGKSSQPQPALPEMFHGSIEI
jgi:hypothetical protein